MPQNILLDSGIIVSFCSKNPPPDIEKLFEKISTGQYHAIISITQLSEISFHLCKFYNKETTRRLIYSLLDKYQIQTFEPTADVLLDVGLLRKNYPKLLSYIDCTILLFCSQNKFAFHTTEKKLNDILNVELMNKVKIVKYKFD